MMLQTVEKKTNNRIIRLYSEHEQDLYPEDDLVFKMFAVFYFLTFQKRRSFKDTYNYFAWLWQIP